jgi:HEPN domain-containing protein
MKIEQRILNLFEELIKTAERISQGRKTSGGHYTNSEHEDSTFYSYDDAPQYVSRIDSVNVQDITQWGMNCLHLLRKIFREDSDYYQKFNDKFKWFNNDKFKWFNIEDNHETFSSAFSILRAAKTDFQNDYLFNTRTLIEAEVFDDFLEQAEQLFEKGYYQPAAVIAGCVLEDGLRKLCDKKGIAISPKATIDPMNVELAKAEIYNALWQKKITALADLRNKAAHGKWNEFNEKDVEDMIRDVRRFMEDYFS